MVPVGLSRPAGAADFFERGSMSGRHISGSDEPPLGSLVRGFIGSGLAFGGLLLGGETGLGLLLIGMTTTVAGAMGFAVAYLSRWRRRRE